MDFSEIAPGFRYRDIELYVSKALQSKKLKCCLIDPGIYGSFVDLTHFCNEAILAATKSGLSINGNVHTTDRIISNQRVCLDVPVVMSGQVTKMETVPRGILITSEFTFTLPDGTVPLRTIRTSTRLNPNGAISPSSKKVTHPEADLSSYLSVAKCIFDPDRVTEYSSEGRNAIHYDPKVAAKFGYRAPIAGGLMGVRSLMASLCHHDGPPNTIDMSIRFRRPMFWDETLDVMHRRNDEDQITHLALVNASGKIAIEAELT